MKTKSLVVALSLLSSLLTLALPSPVRADVRLSGSGRMKQGTTMHLEVFGFGIDFANDFSGGNASGVSGSNVTARITRRHNGPENLVRPGVNRNEGSVEIDFTASGNAAHGLRTVTLRFNVGSSQTFDILVLRNGVVTNMNPRQAAAAATVDFTFAGTHIGNARLASSPPLSNVQRLANTEAEARFRVRFPDLTTRTTYSFRLAEDGFGNSSDFNYEGAFTVVVEPNLSAPDCVSNPGLEAVRLTSPQNGTVINFSPNDTNTQTDVTFSWVDPQVLPTQRNTRKYIFHLSDDEHFIVGNRIDPINLIHTTGVGELSFRTRLQRNRTYFWTVRVFNCGQASPGQRAFRLVLR